MRKKHLLPFFLFALLLVFVSAPVRAAKWQNTKSGVRYLTDSGRYIKSRWKKIGGKWYYFDTRGILQTGRFKVGNRYYYVTRSGGRAQNKKVGWYYYGSDGAMVKNCWKTVDKKYYYFGEDGKMKTGQFTVGNKTYYCDKRDGRVTDKRVGDYYYNQKGVMVKKCWKENYFYGKDGRVVYGRFRFKKKYYYCSESGGMVKNHWQDGYYYDENGVMATSCWVGYLKERAYVNEEGVITKGNKEPKDPPSREDIRLLALLIYYEAGNQPYRAMVAVGSVVINRVENKLFPDTLREVIYQPGQFDPAMNGVLTWHYNSGKPVQENCEKAAIEVLQEGSKLKGYYFFNLYGGERKIGDQYFSKSY